MTKANAVNELKEKVEYFNENMTADENGNSVFDEREKTAKEIKMDKKRIERAEEIINLLNADEKDFVSDVVWGGIESYVNLGLKINALSYIGM